MLDLEFYRAYYEDVRNLPIDDLVKHWKSVGVAEGRHSNPFSALESCQMDPRLPEGFDVSAYLSYNQDVARATRWDFQAIDHYLNFGVRENRRYSHQLLPATKQDTADAPPLSRAADETEPLLFGRFSITDVTKRYRQILTAGADRTVPHEFNLATYLARYPDVRDYATSPEKGLVHFLKHGEGEGRSGTPSIIDPSFVSNLYGIDLPSRLSARAAPAFLRKQLGVKPSDLLFLSEQELLSFHRIDSASFRIHFNHEYYALTAFPNKQSVTPRAQSLKHFCEIGQFQAIDISPEWAFDENFYFAEYVADAEAIAASGDMSSRRREFFQSWLHRAAKDWVFPNLHLLIKASFGLKVPKSVESQIARLGRLIPELANARPSAIVRHLVESPGRCIPYIDIVDHSAANFLTEIGDRFATGDNFVLADIAYAHVLRALPLHGSALRHRADQVHRQKLYGLDIVLRSEIVDAGVADKWTFLNLAKSLSELGDIKGAARVLKEGSAAFPEDWALKINAQAGAVTAFDDIMSRATGLAFADGITNAQNAIRAAAIEATPKFGGARFRRSIRRVAVCGFYALPQCRFYRVELKAEQLSFLGLEVETFDLEQQMDAYFTALEKFDLVILHRVPAVPAIIELIRRTNDLGIPTVYDIDDLIFDADHYPPSLESYAGQIDALTHAGLAASVPLYDYAMSLCDYGISSTNALKSHVEKRVRSGVAVTLPNALTDSHMQFAGSPRRYGENDPVVIFYGSATKAHKQDFKDLIEPALRHVIEKNGSKIRVVIFGHIELSEPLRRIKDQIILNEPLPNIQDYWEALKLADINLSVLERSAFNDCKSEIKWLEAAMMGIPSVLSRTKTYEEIVEDGVTGFLCDTPLDFARSLDRLIGDASLRKKIGEAARKVVLENYSLELQAAKFDAFFKYIAKDRPVARKRLVIVNVFYAPQSIGGATRVVQDNVKDLRQILGDEWNIDIISTLIGGEKPYEVTWRVEDGIRVFAITAANRGDVDSLVEDPAMGVAFDHCLRMIEPDLVHFHCIQRLTVSAVDAVRRRKIPYIVTMHDGWWISPNHFIVDAAGKAELFNFRSAADGQLTHKDFPARALPLRRALKNAQRILTVSESFAKICREVGLTTVGVTENGVSNLSLIAREVNCTGRVRLGHVGGTQLHKGLPLVRNILMSTKFNNLSLLLIDHSFEPGAIENDIWGTTPVEIRGKISPTKVCTLYSRIDVLLAPSIWPESYGLVTREAVAAGCWVIASDRGAVGECVSHEQNGFIVSVDSPYELKQVLHKIDANPQAYLQPPEFSAPLRSARKQAEELANLYSSILEDRTLSDGEMSDENL